MANQSASVSFQTLLESALLQYEKKTGVTLSKHPLALQLQSCNSVEDLNTILQDKAKDVRESERIIKSMKTIVSILTPLSSVASLPDAVGLVRYMPPEVTSYSDLFLQTFPPAKAIPACLGVLLDVCAILWSICGFPCDTQVIQSAKGEISKFDALVNWLESIEHFVGRLSIYLDTTLPPAMVEIVVKIMVELISTFALVTKKLKERKRGEFILPDVLPYSARHRQTQESFEGQAGR